MKYLVVTTFAISVLAADGWWALSTPSMRTRVRRVAIGCVVTAVLFGIAIGLAATAPALAERALAAMARRVPVDPLSGAAFLLRVGPALAARTAALLLAAAALIGLSTSAGARGSRARLASYLLVIAMAADTKSLRALRNRVVLLLGFAGAFRRSETMLDWESAMGLGPTK